MEQTGPPCSQVAPSELAIDGRRDRRPRGTHHPRGIHHERRSRRAKRLLRASRRPAGQAHRVASRLSGIPSHALHRLPNPAATSCSQVAVLPSALRTSGGHNRAGNPNSQGSRNDAVTARRQSPLLAAPAVLRGRPARTRYARRRRPRRERVPPQRRERGNDEEEEKRKCEWFA